MDRLITELEELTAECLEGIETISVEQLTAYVEKRSALVDSILSHFPSPAEKAEFQPRIALLISLDSVFLDKMHHFRNEASENLAKFDAGRMQRNAYDRNDAYESFFFDKRK